MQAIKTLKFEDVYIIKSVISRGLMGNVYKVINRINQVVYAAKKVFKNKIRNFDQKRLQNIGETLIKMQHPNIASSLEIYDNPDSIFIVMEYVKGIDLIDWLIRLNSRDEVKICGVLKTLLDALQFSHSRGILHGYIQPSSIMVSDYQVSFHRTLFPFITQQSIYSAPERNLSTSCDMWSIGVLLYVMLTGRNPFQNNNIWSVSNQEQLFPWHQWRYISCCAKDLLKNLLKVDPKQRFDIESIKNHPWVNNIGNLPSQYPQLKYNLIRQNFNLRTERALNVTSSYLQQ